MSTNVVNQTAYIPTSRNFPPEAKQLTVEVTRAYIDIANAVNFRTIGIYSINKPAINGESWFLSPDRRQQALRQVYILPSGTVNGTTIDIGFKINSISQFTSRCYGSFTDGTNWYGLIYASNVAIAGQVSFYVAANAANSQSDRITILVGAGAPAITSGFIVLEWTSQSQIVI